MVGIIMRHGTNVKCLPFSKSASRTSIHTDAAKTSKTLGLGLGLLSSPILKSYFIINDESFGSCAVISGSRQKENGRRYLDSRVLEDFIF